MKAVSALIFQIYPDLMQSIVFPVVQDTAI